MVRSAKKARRLVVGGRTYLWSVGHRHQEEDGRFLDCREILTVRPDGADGRLLISFRHGPGRLVPDGFLHSGAVGTTEGRFLNLHEPGTVRALLDEAMSRGGWCPTDPPPRDIDGWSLFDAAATRRR